MYPLVDTITGVQLEHIRKTVCPTVVMGSSSNAVLDRSVSSFFTLCKVPVMGSSSNAVLDRAISSFLHSFQSFRPVSSAICEHWLIDGHMQNFSVKQSVIMMGSAHSSVARSKAKYIRRYRMSTSPLISTTNYEPI